MHTFVMYAACKMIIYPQKPSIIVHASLAQTTKSAAGIHNWPRPLGPGLQYPGCSVGMHGVASHPSHFHYGAVHHPLPCKTSAQNAVVPRWLGNAKDARVVIRFGTACEGWATEDVTDMLRVTFTVLGYLEKKGRDGFPDKGHTIQHAGYICKFSN